MLPQRFTSSQSSAVRKQSRLADGRVSMIPKPRRPGSTDRLSTEARRPSTAGYRSSSAEPSYGGFGGGRDASATKVPKNRRSRSQQSDRFGQSFVTPMRSSQYSSRPTTTPQRTPSDDRNSRSRDWRISLDRALAFVIIKDERPTSNAAWQRAALGRVQEALAARGCAATLVRPLTIARFVDIVGSLLASVHKGIKVNTDNYVAKLPNIAKRLQYPAPVSKSWLKTVNTLHAFPHALACIAYLLDLANCIEAPVCDQSLFIEKDELMCLRREFLFKCWARFQKTEGQFEDLSEEYLQNLQALLGNDEEKIEELHQLIKKYELCLEDEEEAASIAEEARLQERRAELLAALRDERAARGLTRAEAEREAGRAPALCQDAKSLDLEIDKANAESEQLRLEVEAQSMSVEERARLLDEVDYTLRVQDSKRALVHQITKLVQSKETELALWQKKTLDACVEYKQGLIHHSARMPHLAAFIVDENGLMEPECARAVEAAVAALRSAAGALAGACDHQARSKGARARRRLLQLDETRTKIAEMKCAISRSQPLLQAEADAEAEAGARAARALAAARERVEALRPARARRAARDHDLQRARDQDLLWRTKLSALREYILSKRIESKRVLEYGITRRAELVRKTVAELHAQLQRC